MSTCWDDPSRCRGCNYCQQARDSYNEPGGPTWARVTPEQAHLADLADQAAAFQARQRAAAERRAS